MSDNQDLPHPNNTVDIFHYVEATGEIKGVGACKFSDLPLQEPMHDGWAIGHGSLVFTEIGNYYAVDKYNVLPRPNMGLPATVQLVADGEDEAVIGPLPEGCKVWVDGAEVTEFDEDNTLSLSSDMPATYHIVFECWPYQRHVMELEANAAT
jgi:hypothetical protein